MKFILFLSFSRPLDLFPVLRADFVGPCRDASPEACRDRLRRQYPLMEQFISLDPDLKDTEVSSRRALLKIHRPYPISIRIAVGTASFGQMCFDFRSLYR